MIVATTEPFDALVAALAELKSADPLAPVTVAAPSAWAALSLRRALSRGAGLVNVRFVVLAGVAELLGGPRLAAEGRMPLTATLRYHAVTEALATRAGPFARALDHPAALAALAERIAELERADVETREAISRSGGAALVSLASDVTSRLAAFYGPEDLALAAAAAAEAGDTTLADLGRVIVYLPARLSPADRRLVDALQARDAATVVFGLLGDPEADEPTVELASALGSPVAAPEPIPVVVDRLVVAPDPDIEVRLVAQELTARLEAGDVLSRIAVLYRKQEPYARLLVEHLTACGLPVAGPGTTTLAQSVSGRTLLGLLGLAKEDFSRHAVLSVLNGGPILQSPGHGAPVVAWERLSRDANVVRGLERWRQRLDHLRQRLEEEAGTLDRAGEPEVAESRRLSARRAGDLRAWVDATAARSTPPARASWTQLASWAEALLDATLDLAALDAAELEAHEQVRAGLARLGQLGGPPPDPARFQTALALELDVPAGPAGPFGQGVFVGPLRAAVGSRFDAVIVVGMAEGWFPPRRGDDPLLPDRLRATNDLQTRRRQRQEERCSFLSALRASPAVVLTAPRSDLRSQQPRLPARWFVEAAAARAGHAVKASDLCVPHADWPWLDVVPSLTATLQRPPASTAELRLGELQRWAGHGDDARQHPFLAREPALQRGLEATAARADGGLSEWEGLVGRHPLLAIDPGRPLSPTSLQRWAECPRRYLFERVLHIHETARPEEVLQLNALDLGTLVHAALEEFFRERAEAGDLGRAWADADRVRLLDIVEARCADVEAQGLTGKPVLWAMQRRNLHEHLQVFLEHDAAHRAGGGGLVPQDFEVGFGGPEDELGPLTLAVGSRTLRFHGRIDRVDATPDGSVVEVIDYKTGRSEQVGAIDQDCVDEGRRLQLPVYALAASRAFPDATVTASYWFVTDTGSRHEHKPVPLTDVTRARFEEVVEHIADGIEDGVFPGHPGEEDRETWVNCRYCPYDRICPSQRDEIWERVALSDEAGSYRSLARS